MKVEDVLPKLHELIVGNEDIELTVPVGKPSYEKVLRTETRAIGYRNGTTAIGGIEQQEAQAEVSYWRSLRSLLEAEQLLDSSDLPNVDLPDTSKSVLMERCAFVEEWAADVLAQARKIANPEEEDDATGTN